MANTVFPNKVISSKATELLLTQLNTRNYMTIDTELEGSEGMTRTINTYTYTGEAEELAAGAGSTAAKRGSISYVGKDYTVKCIQEAFDYLDEDFMKDSKCVDYGTQGATEVMVNFLSNKFYAALETDDGDAQSPTRLISTVNFAKNSAIDYDTIVDAISAVGLENESDLFILLPNEWKADIRKDDDYKSARMGEVIYSGQIGTVAGIPVIPTKLLDHSGSGASLVKARAYVMTKEAVTLFVKKAMEVEQDRNKDTRANAVYLREYYICALTNATKAVRIEEAAA